MKVPTRTDGERDSVSGQVAGAQRAYPDTHRVPRSRARRTLRSHGWRSVTSPTPSVPECIQRGGSSASQLVRAHYDRYGFYFAESKSARAAFLRYSQLGQLVRNGESEQGPIIDVGCGEGRIYRLLSERQCLRYLGLDLSSGVLARAQRLLPGVPLLRGDAGALPIRSAAASFVICQGVLHHTEDPRRTFGELARVTSAGGLIQLSVYNRRAMYYYLVVALGWISFHLARTRFGRALLAVTLFPFLYVLLLEPAHLVYGAHMPVGGAWRFFLDQYAHPRVWFFRGRQLCRWAEEEGLEVVAFDAELAGWMLSLVLRKPDRV